MRPDRQGPRSHLRAVEVMGMTTNGDAATVEIARLFEVAGREGEAIRRLDGCVTELHEVQAAKTALQKLAPTQLRAALDYRRRALEPGQAS
jgi:hypothetical protein